MKGRMTLDNGDLTAYALRQGYAQTSEIGNKVCKGAVVIKLGDHRRYIVYVDGFPATKRIFEGLKEARSYFKSLQKVWGQGARIPYTRYYTFTHWLLNTDDANYTVMNFIRDAKNGELFVVMFNGNAELYKRINVYSMAYEGIIIDYKCIIENFGYYKNNAERRSNVLIKGRIKEFVQSIIEEMATYGFITETYAKDINVKNIQVLWG